MKLTSERVLRVLSRFDGATVEDIASALHRSNHNVWARLQSLVDAGFVAREGAQRHRYSITDSGREQLAKVTA